MRIQHVYRFTTSRSAMPSYLAPTPGSLADYLEQSLAEALAWRIEQDISGRFVIEIEVNSGDSHDETLAELTAVLARVGLNFAAAEITEYTSAAIANAVGGAIAGTGVGGAVAAVGGAIVGGAIGLALGDIVGDARLRVVRRYSSTRGSHGDWNFRAGQVGFAESVGWRVTA